MFETSNFSVTADTATHDMLDIAQQLRNKTHGETISFSKKVFIPLTRLCRDTCHYCTYAKTPRNLQSAYMSRDEVLAVARAGAAAGCKEALFTLGDKPELRYKVARQELAKLGHSTTLEYVAEMAELVFKETGLFPHINAGVMSGEEIAMLRKVSISQGLMLENISQRLCEKGGPHYGSPDKNPAIRLETIRQAGKLGVPFTSGILIGIGETRKERLQSLRALHDLHLEYGHIQEIIIQNFCPKPDTKMSDAPAATIDELVWTIAATRLIFGSTMNIQAPPNLNKGELHQLITAGINDLGGVSPVTPDFVNPEAPWPHIEVLRQQIQDAGKELVERLAVYPEYTENTEKWLDRKFLTPVTQCTDSEGYPKEDAWSPGQNIAIPNIKTAVPIKQVSRSAPQGQTLQSLLSRCTSGDELSEGEIVQLFKTRGEAFTMVCTAADNLRRSHVGDKVTYVINRNINYTNVCTFKCTFCAFSKGKKNEKLRGKAYDLELDEIARRAREAYDRGATEVCLQGGIHPDYTGETYLEICRAIKAAVPEMHIHAFSALEVSQGAKTNGMTVANFLEQLKQAGLNSLPGTAAEILDDEIRTQICSDKLGTEEWLDVISTAHKVGLKTTSTIMFGHIEKPIHWARHLLHLRHLQAETGGITEFVPLPFVHMEAPVYLRGQARSGPTYREAVLMHAVARLVLNPFIDNIQTSWTKMGLDGAKACLQAGCNDLGGTLMNESISRAAGSQHGQECSAAQMEQLIRDINRTPQQRTTLYNKIDDRRLDHVLKEQPLKPLVNNVPKWLPKRKIS